MDTGTHIVMGISLGGLAMVDPGVAQSPATVGAVLIGTFVGSLAPDFDTLFKLKDNAAYIRQHRGLSHSIPALFAWPLAISTCVFFFFPDAAWWHLLFWTFLAVFLHIFVDLFNAYGTQALRPFSNRWVALGIINIFDPVIFFTCVAGIGVWVLDMMPPGPVFLSVFSLLAGYYIWRIWAHFRLIKKIRRRFPDAEYVNVSPSFRWGRRHVSIRTPTQYHVAEIKRNHIVIFDTYERMPVPDDPVMKTALRDKNVQSFLNFSPIYRWEMTKYPDYDEVRFIDLRYRDKNGHYPFVAIVLVDPDLNRVSSFTGWVHSENKLQKKLELAMD